MESADFHCTRIQSKVEKFFQCCGIQLQFAVKLLAIFDIAVSLAWIVRLSQNYSKYWNTPNQHFTSNSTAPQVIWGCSLVQSTATTFLSVLLFSAATSCNIRKCKLWIFMITVVSLASVTVTGIRLSFYYDGDLAWLFTIILIALVVFRMYSILIVCKFIKSVRLTRSNCPRNLQKREVDMFFKGTFRYFPPPRHFREVQRVECGPYDMNFEIYKDRLNIDEENPLEKTSDGLLLKGNMSVPGGCSILVGVKTTKDKIDVAEFRAILSELKIMTYVASIRKHENVAELMGAVTGDIIHRKLWMIFEYFPFGNLNEFLKNHRGSFVNLVKNGTLSRENAIQHYTNVHQMKDDHLITTFALIRWAFEICNGLQYLSSIGVVHADLCTKNVYLTEDKIAKISLPSLPLQLYRYSSYDKKDEIPLFNWRWMSIESLRDMIFTSRSDVWSAGITIHEIFSLGGLPFSGLSWTPDFASYLARGMRMNKAAFATNKIYKKLLECWDNDPTHRPTPQQLCTFFETILRDHNSFCSLTNVGVCESDDNISTDSSCIATPLGSV